MTAAEKAKAKRMKKFAEADARVVQARQQESMVNKAL